MQRIISSDIISINSSSRAHWLILRSCASVFVLLRGDTLATREGGVKGNTPQVSLLPLVSAAGTPPFSTAHFHSLPQNRLKERRGREGGRGGEGGRANRGREERASDKKVKKSGGNPSKQLKKACLPLKTGGPPMATTENQAATPSKPVESR